MTALCRRAAGLVLLALTATLPHPSRAEVPYDGWRGVRTGEPYYAGADNGRRPLDGSPRSAPPFSSPTLLSPPKPVYRSETWTGFYAGLHTGGGWGSVTPNGLSSSDVSISGLAGGGQLGYNLQVGSIVGGIEADASWANMDGARLFSESATAANASLDWTASLRGRLGYAWDNLLIYGTAGVAYGGVGLDVMSSGFSSNHERVSGLVYGAGVDMKLTPQLSARIEALRYNFGEGSFSTSAGPLSVGTDVTTVRAGLSWHFN